MMRFQQLTTLATAALVIVPAGALQDGPHGGLENAIARTSAAIARTRSVQSELAGGLPAAVEKILTMTPPAPLDAQARDARLHELRLEVSRLQQDFDELVAGGPSSTALDAAGPGAVSGPGTTHPPVHTGFDPNELSALGGTKPSVTGPGSQLGSISTERFEEPGFSLDPVRHGRALFRAGRIEEAVSLLERRSEDLRAEYWLARCHEKLGRVDLALAGYRNVADTDVSTLEDPEAATLVGRAAIDIEFLEWKRSFDLRLERHESEQS